MRRWKHGWIWFNMGWIWFNMIQYAYSELFWVVQKGSNLVRSLHCSLAICSFICVVCGNGFNVPPGSSGWYKYSSIPMDLSVPRPSVSCHKTSIWLSIPTVYLLCDSVVFKCSFFAFVCQFFVGTWGSWVDVFQGIDVPQVQIQAPESGGEGWGSALLGVPWVDDSIVGQIPRFFFGPNIILSSS